MTQQKSGAQGVKKDSHLDDDTSLDDVMATWEQIKNESYKTINHRHIDRMPRTWYVEEDKLWTRDTLEMLDLRCGLTDRRRKTIYTYLKLEHLQETADVIDTSPSYVDEAVRLFPQILDTPEYIEAFILDSTVPRKEQWALRYSEGEYKVGERKVAFNVARRLHQKHDEVADVISPDGDIFSPIQEYDETWLGEKPDPKIIREGIGYTATQSITDNPSGVTEDVQDSEENVTLHLTRGALDRLMDAVEVSGYTDLYDEMEIAPDE